MSVLYDIVVIGAGGGAVAFDPKMEERIQP
jgi:hypothetical protein